MKMKESFSAKRILDNRTVWIAAAVGFFCLILAVSVNPVHAVNYQTSYCSGSLAPSTAKYCGEYDALSLSPYLDSTTSGTDLFVGYCVVSSGGQCSGTANDITPGHYGAIGWWYYDTPVYSIYANTHSSTVSFSGTDYWIWN